MTIDELTERLMSYPRDARVTGYIEQDSGRAGLLVMWTAEERIRTAFIETALFPPGAEPAPPKRAQKRKE